MTSEEFQKLRATFDRLLEASEAERAAILDQLQQSDSALARELDGMLAAHLTRTSMLDRPIAERIGIPTAYSPPVRDGSQIGPYRIEKELGLGGMGVVYLATRTYGDFERQVAIKILRHDRIDHLFLNRFQRERQILAQLNHPHIASILDAGETPDGDPYFVMEYVDGAPITAHCEAHALSINAEARSISADLRRRAVRSPQSNGASRFEAGQRSGDWSRCGKAPRFRHRQAD